jgi:membrane protein
LAYSTLLALIPMLAVVLSITTGVLKQRGEEPISRFVEKMVEHITPYTNPALATDAASAEALARAAEERKRAVKEINNFISRIRSGTLGVTGMIALVFVGIFMLARIEGAFNDIWGVTRGRSWYLRVVLYWAAMTLGPVLLILTLGLASGRHWEISEKLLRSVPVGDFLFELLPVVILGAMFGLFYLLMPNTRVRWQAALLGGFVAGTLWHLNNWLSAYFVSRITSNNAIYGSLGIIPVFMIGLYFGWVILLFGAQVAYAFQNRESYVEGKQIEGVHQRGREYVAWRIMAHLAQSFHQGDPAPGVNRIAAAIGVPTRLVAQVLRSLLQAHLVVEVIDPENGYAPGRALEQITAHDVLMAMRVGQGYELAIPGHAEGTRVRTEFERVSQAEKKAAASVTMKDFVIDQSAQSGS